MPILGWSETIPADTDSVGLGPQQIKSHITAVATGLGTWLYWPGSGGGSADSGGVLKPGASRFYRGNASDSSVDDDDQNGRGYYDATKHRLYIYDSGTTLRIGARGYEEHVSRPAADTLWARETNSYFTDQAGAGSYTTTWSNVSFTASPASALVVSSETFVTVGISALSAGGFTSRFSSVKAGTSGVTLSWSVLGKTGRTTD